MLGYLNRPNETAQMIDKDGWLHTGDIAYLDESNLLYVVDRLKELIKVKGLQVAPAELEDILLSHPSIADCAVIGISDARTGESPRAYVVKKEERLTERDVFNFVAGGQRRHPSINVLFSEKVAPYKQLKGGVRFISTIPRSPAGKILRRELRDSFVKSKL